MHNVEFGEVIASFSRSKAGVEVPYLSVRWRHVSNTLSLVTRKIYGHTKTQERVFVCPSRRTSVTDSTRAVNYIRYQPPLIQTDVGVIGVII